MNAATLRELSTACLSVEGGFLPRRVPLDVLPGDLRAWSDAATLLPEHFHGPTAGVTGWLDTVFAPLPPDAAAALDAQIDALDEAELDKAFAVLSVLGHAYRWDHVPATPDRYQLTSLRLPDTLDRAWRRVTQRFGVPRVGTLYSMVLCNWRLPGRAGGTYLNEEIDGDRLVVAHPWLRGPNADELHCFLMTAIETEARGALAVRTIVDLAQAVESDSLQEVLFLLDRLLDELDRMSRPFRNNIQKKKIAPDSFLTLIQPPTIWGLDDGDGQGPLEGASGPQVGSVQCIDALLGAGHVAPISQAIRHTRKYLPERHRVFIEAVEAAGPHIKAYIEATHDPQARRLFNACIEGIVGWRRIHEKRGAMYLRGEKAGDGAYASTGGVVSMADERVRVFEQAMVARQEEVLAAAIPVAELTADDELAHALPSLTEEDREAILAGAEARMLDADATLIQAGARREGLYLLRKGAVRVVRSRNGEPVVIARIGAGSLFGEMSFFENEDASASVEAECPCEVALIPREHVFAVFRARPGVATRFYQSLAALVAQRLRDTSRRLADDTRQGPARAPRAAAEVPGTPALSRAARAAGRAFCDALETLEEIADDAHSVEAGVRRAGSQLVSDCQRMPAGEVVRYAWPRVADSALANTLSARGADAADAALHAEIAVRLAQPPEGESALGQATDAWLRGLPTPAGFAALGPALADRLTTLLQARPGARVLLVLPAFAGRFVEALGPSEAHVTLVHPAPRVGEQARAAARRLGAQSRLRVVAEPVERLRRQAVETFWRPFDVIVADTLLLAVDDDDTEPLLDWLFSMLAPDGTAFFGAALADAPDAAFLQAVGHWPPCRRDEAGVLSTFDETRAHAVHLDWRDPACAWAVVVARHTAGEPTAAGEPRATGV